MSRSEQVENLLDEWEELLEGNPSADLAAFIARYAGDLDRESKATFCAKAEELAAINRRLDAWLDTDGVLSDTSDVTSDSLTLTQLHEGFEPIQGYTLVTRLGSGGFGEVWKAMAPGDFPVALKFVRFDGRPGEIERRSLEVMRDVRHPHLLSIFGTWQRGDLLIIATELADRTLLDRHKEAVTIGDQGIPRQELLEYMAEAAKGIDFLNEPGTSGRPKIQHRDVKPQNLLLSGDSVKVGDFGLARAFKFDATGHTGSLTLAYAAPEFLNGETSNRSDQYSLAVTYCFLRGGRLPFEGTAVQVIDGHRRQQPDLSMLTEVERPIVARALSKKPKDRWPSCKGFVKALESAAGETSQPSGLLHILKTWAMNNRAISVAIVPIFLVLVLLAYWIFQSDNPVVPRNLLRMKVIADVAESIDSQSTPDECLTKVIRTLKEKEQEFNVEAPGLIDEIRETRFFCEDLLRTQEYSATVRIYDVKLLSNETADFSPHAITIKSATVPPSDYSLTPTRSSNQLVFQPKFDAFDLRIGVGRTLTCTLWKYERSLKTLFSHTWTEVDEVEVVDEAGPLEAIGMLLPQHRQTTFKRSIRMAGGYEVLLEFSDVHHSDNRQVPTLLWDAALHAEDMPHSTDGPRGSTTPGKT